MTTTAVMPAGTGAPAGAGGCCKRAGCGRPLPPGASGGRSREFCGDECRSGTTTRCAARQPSRRRRRDGPEASLGKLSQLLAEASRLASAASAQVAAADPDGSRRCWPRPRPPAAAPTRGHRVGAGRRAGGVGGRGMEAADAAGAARDEAGARGGSRGTGPRAGTAVRRHGRAAGGRACPRRGSRARGRAGSRRARRGRRGARRRDRRSPPRRRARRRRTGQDPPGREEAVAAAREQAARELAPSGPPARRRPKPPGNPPPRRPSAGRAEAALDAERAERRALTGNFTAAAAQPARTRPRATTEKQP